jgi:carboxylesterase type B
MDAWVNFVKGSTPQDGHGVDWPKYTEANRDLVRIGQRWIDTGHDPDTQLLDHL